MKRLIHQIADDNSEAFGEIFELFYEKVYRFSGYFISSNVIREDVVSDVFLALWQSRKSLKKVDNIEAYLYTATRNKALYYINQAKQQFSVKIDDSLPIGILTDSNNPEEIVITEELKNIIDKSVKELPERCQLIFLMAREEGLKYREIAEILSLSEKTINAQMVLAIKKLGTSIRNYLS